MDPMPQAELIADRHLETAPARPRRGHPPLALRPLHRMWRRTIDEIEVARIDLPVRGLAGAHRGAIACQISDFHVDRDEDLARLFLAVEAINREHPDLVFLTGDYFSGPDTMHRYIDAFRGALRHLKPRSGIFAILGNHDHWSSSDRVTDALHSAGAEVLINQSRRVNLRGSELVVVGIDDLWARRAEPARAFSTVKPEDTTIVLAHNPDTALYARHLRPGVMLSGHTHGGVVRIPYYGSPLRSILKIGKRFYSGLNRYEDFYIYTNRGLGTFWLRIRINCRPEVSRFALEPFSEISAEAPERPARARRTRNPAKPRRIGKRRHLNH